MVQRACREIKGQPFSRPALPRARLSGQKGGRGRGGLAWSGLCTVRGCTAGQDQSIGRPGSVATSRLGFAAARQSCCLSEAHPPVTPSQWNRSKAAARRTVARCSAGPRVRMPIPSVALGLRVACRLRACRVAGHGMHASSGCGPRLRLHSRPHGSFPGGVGRADATPALSGHFTPPPSSAFHARFEARVISAGLLESISTSSRVSRCSVYRYTLLSPPPCNVNPLAVPCHDICLPLVCEVPTNVVKWQTSPLLPARGYEATTLFNSARAWPLRR